MRFLIIGCNGMAGHMVSLYLKEQGHDVTGLARSVSKFIHTILCDAANLEQVRKIIADARYDSVVNCTGLLNQYAEHHHSAAIFINSYFPHFLAEITSGTSTQIIHMSTDCVFSGKTGPYTEDSFRDGTTFYDRSKALGELEDEKNITLRNSIVGPDIKQEGIGLLNWFMQQHREVKGYTKAIWTGQTTLQLAKTVEAAAKKRAHGLYNMVPSYGISKYELLKLFNCYFRNNSLIIHPIEGMAADKTLIRTRFDFDYMVPDYEKMMKELSEWMQAHKNLYPHYRL